MNEKEALAETMAKLLKLKPNLKANFQKAFRCQQKKLKKMKGKK